VTLDTTMIVQLHTEYKVHSCYMLSDIEIEMTTDVCLERHIIQSTNNHSSTIYWNLWLVLQRIKYIHIWVLIFLNINRR